MNLNSILHHHCEALGGAERLQHIHAWHATYRVDVLFWQGRAEEFYRAPDKSRFEIISEVTNETTGCDGQTRWRLDQNQQVQVLQEKTIAGAGKPNVLPDYQYLFPSPQIQLRSLPAVNIDEVRCFVLEKIEGDPPEVEQLFIDATTFLLKRRILHDQGLPVQIDFSDYRPIQGLQVAHRFVQSTPIAGFPALDFQLEHIRLNPLLPDSLFQIPTSPAKDVVFVDPVVARQIPVEIHNYHIYVPVQVNDSPPVLFILDSGAGSTVISQELADQLHIPRRGTMPILGVGGQQLVEAVQVEKFRLPGVEIHHQRTYAMDLSEVRLQTGREVHGVLGYDLFIRCVIRVDYEQQRLGLFDPRGFAYSGEGEVLTGKLVTNILQIPGSINGIEGDFRVDTGSSGCLHLGIRVLKEHNLLKNRQLMEVNTFGIGGESLTYLTRMENLQLGHVRIPDPLVALVAEEANILSLESTLGTIGGQILHKFTVYFDYSRRQLILEKNRLFDQPLQVDTSGMRPIPEAEQLGLHQTAQSGVPEFSVPSKV